MRHTHIYIMAMLACLAVLAGSCGMKSERHAAAADTVAFRYATLLRVERCDGYTLATVANPWHAGSVLRRYVLVPAAAPMPSSLPDGIVLRTPLRRAAVFMSAHCGLLASLGRLGAVSGVCDYRYILNPAVRRHVAAGRAADFGSAMQPDVERIAATRPDAMLVSPFAGSGGYGRLEALGIPLVECADYMEQSPLARAEWMRFYGLLFGCGYEADSLFAVVERNYLALRGAAARTKERPRLMCDLVQGSAWYVPGGRSTIGQAFADAGADYVFARNCDAGSVGKTFETVYDAALDADVWVIRGGTGGKITYASLRKEREAYSHFRPWKERRVFACNTFEVPYFDESPFRPDYLLNDLVRICHPQLSSSEPLHYFSPLQ